ncbi:MAG: phasin family protein [Granulosicoccus sp.]
MQNITENMNEQFKQMLDLQTRSLEPLRIFAGLSADAVEQVARQNYAVAGDMLEFAAKSANLPLSGDDFQGVASAQVAEASTFAELMGTRASEYAEMAQNFNSKAREAAESAANSFNK